jgi:integrase
VRDLAIKTEKSPLSESELARLENEARKSKDWEAVVLMRWTGMHPSVIVEPRYGLREVDHEGRAVIEWKRPKKQGKDAYTAILRSRRIDFDVNDYIAEFQARRRRRSRQYLHELVRKAGEDAGLPGVSPMSLRHSACVNMLERGVPETTVRQILNVSSRTMMRYSKYTKAGKVDALERVGW